MDAIVDARRGTDSLSEALRSLRFRGRVLCRSHLRAPWGFTVKGAQAASFHFVLAGSCLLETERDPIPLGAGDLVILPRGDDHTLRDSPGSPALVLDDLVAANPPD